MFTRSAHRRSGAGKVGRPYLFSVSGFGRLEIQGQGRAGKNILLNLRALALALVPNPGDAVQWSAVHWQARREAEWNQGPCTEK